MENCTLMIVHLNVIPKYCTNCKYFWVFFLTARTKSTFYYKIISEKNNGDVEGMGFPWMIWKEAEIQGLIKTNPWGIYFFIFFIFFIFYFSFSFFFYSCNFKERWGVTKICEVSRSRNFYRISKNLEILVASFWYGMSSHPCFLFLEQTSTKSYSLNYFFLKKKSTKLRHLIFCR